MKSVRKRRKRRTAIYIDGMNECIYRLEVIIYLQTMGRGTNKLVIIVPTLLAR